MEAEKSLLQVDFFSLVSELRSQNASVERPLTGRVLPSTLYVSISKVVLWHRRLRTLDSTSA